MLATNSNHRIAFFENSAPYYDFLLSLLTFGQYAKFQKMAVEFLAPQPGEKILDLCSGTGRVASWTARAVGSGGEVVGMDISQRMVEWSRKRYKELEKTQFLQKDVTQPWEYQNHFDGIFVSFALHELPEEKRLTTLEYSFLALKEKGRIVIADFHPQVLGIGKMTLLVFFKLFERDNLNFFSFDLYDMLKRVGFKRIKTFLVLAGLFQITLAHRSAD